jgi:hypothetical protein
LDDSKIHLEMMVTDWKGVVEDFFSAYCSEISGHDTRSNEKKTKDTWIMTGCFFPPCPFLQYAYMKAVHTWLYFQTL